ncbi:holo-ACP synthase [Calidifontibacter sp. DB0510]|uniref:Holo-[acyl-carrier-protein] synthase n=1 Tax=Metallococcus carri TaxID=1656884 RepID=A0A967E9R3_9MICO|nr:holo-ACP synthase [Metallococcus carri]NHN56657.1 holo-ACP synthase [Metallococcus carri]NOP38956.1 holo-ACP synthase [Calidifontibacter sp. DB2511S]
MILGVGLDVVDIERFTATLQRTPTLAGRLFVESELDLPPVSLAGRFAAKEAIAKALGAPAGMAWHDAVVVRGEHGQPSFAISGTVAARAADLGVDRVHLSISHDGGVAVAVVIVEGAPA